MQTAHEIRMTFRDFHTMTIPAGTEAFWVDGGQGGWAIKPNAAHLTSNTASIFKHDTTYYYIWINQKDLIPCP